MILEKNENFVINESMIPPEMSVTIDNARELAREFRDLRMRYHAAIKEISTKLEVLDNEFSVRNDYNPIHHMQCRLKSIESIVDKIGRKGWPMEMESVYKVMDFAGVRVVCNYIDDIYTVEESLLRQDDIKLLKRKDYIKNPKESGYRSLHLIVQVPIFLQNTKKLVYVEVQFRTIAMDFWASLEHKLQYKKNIPESQSKFLKDELYDCAQQSAALDKRMQNIRNVIAASETAEEEKQDFLPIFLRENKG